MTTDDRLSSIEKRLADLERKREHIDRVERNLLEAARQWARLTKLGYMMERASNGEPCRSQMSQRDADDLAEVFLATMLREAANLLRAETSGL